MNRKSKTKTIVLATAITTLLSATAVFAGTTSSNTVQAPSFSLTHSYKVNGWFKSCLDSLVTSGALTQAQEDAIQSTISATPNVGAAKEHYWRGDNGEFKTILDGQVKAGTITKAQKFAIQEAINTAIGNYKRGLYLAYNEKIVNRDIT